MLVFIWFHLRSCARVHWCVSRHMFFQQEISAYLDAIRTMNDNYLDHNIDNIVVSQKYKCDHFMKSASFSLFAGLLFKLCLNWTEAPGVATVQADELWHPGGEGAMSAVCESVNFRSRTMTHGILFFSRKPWGFGCLYLWNPPRYFLCSQTDTNGEFFPTSLNIACFFRCPTRKISTMSNLSPFFPFFCRRSLAAPHWPKTWPRFVCKYGAPNSNGLSSCSINCYPFNSNFGVIIVWFLPLFSIMKDKSPNYHLIYPYDSYDWIAISPLYTSFLNIFKTAKISSSATPRYPPGRPSSSPWHRQDLWRGS